jgi:hypothetical protein
MPRKPRLSEATWPSAGCAMSMRPSALPRQRGMKRTVGNILTERPKLSTGKAYAVGDRALSASSRAAAPERISARLGRDPAESRISALAARRTGEQNGSAQGGRCRLSRSLAGIDPRARRSIGPRPRMISALHSQRSASGRADLCGSPRPLPPFAKPCGN